MSGVDFRLLNYTSAEATCDLVDDSGAESPRLCDISVFVYMFMDASVGKQATIYLVFSSDLFIGLQLFIRRIESCMYLLI